MVQFVRLLTALLVLSGLVSTGQAVASPAAAPPAQAPPAAAPAATTAYDYPLPSSAYIQATKANGEVIVLARVGRIWYTTQWWGVYAGAKGRIQYRPVGTSTWRTLKEITTDLRGHATAIDTSGQAREYRVVVDPHPYIQPKTSAVASTTWCSIPSSLRGKDLTRIPTGAKVVALTFDAGANGDAVDSILATLQAKKVPGTFFLTGQFATKFPSHTRKIMIRYPTGNHSDTHADMTRLSRANAWQEIRRGQLKIRATSGIDPHPWWRFPLGAVNSSLVQMVNDECYVSFRWTVDTLGWKGTSGGMTAAKVRERVLTTATPGQIILMHVGSHPTDRSMLDAQALPSTIDALKARGYHFLTLEQVIRDW